MSGMKRAGFGRVSVLLTVAAVLIPVGFAPAVHGDDGPADPLAASATEFCTLFMDGEDERAREHMTADMQGAVTPAVAEQIRSSLTGSNGVFKRLGEAWKEDEVQGYLRYRVPAEFERGKLDFRVVFDGEHKVAGFFHVPHVDAPGQGSGDQAEAGDQS